uniref:Uncharacterized protein n=1 Tax=Corethron hystrix TaxID=216773 RepID=A0A7S1BRK6_9STRA
MDASPLIDRWRNVNLTEALALSPSLAADAELRRGVSRLTGTAWKPVTLLLLSPPPPSSARHATAEDAVLPLLLLYRRRAPRRGDGDGAPLAVVSLAHACVQAEAGGAPGGTERAEVTASGVDGHRRHVHVTFPRSAGVLSPTGSVIDASRSSCEVRLRLASVTEAREWISQMRILVYESKIQAQIDAHVESESEAQGRDSHVQVESESGAQVMNGRDARRDKVGTRCVQSLVICALLFLFRSYFMASLSHLWGSHFSKEFPNDTDSLAVEYKEDLAPPIFWWREEKKKSTATFDTETPPSAASSLPSPRPSSPPPSFSRHATSSSHLGRLVTKCRLSARAMAASLLRDIYPPERPHLPPPDRVPLLRRAPSFPSHLFRGGDAPFPPGTWIHDFFWSVLPVAGVAVVAAVSMLRGMFPRVASVAYSTLHLGRMLPCIAVAGSLAEDGYLYYWQHSLHDGLYFKGYVSIMLTIGSMGAARKYFSDALIAKGWKTPNPYLAQLSMARKVTAGLSSWLATIAFPLVLRSYHMCSEPPHGQEGEDRIDTCDRAHVPAILALLCFFSGTYFFGTALRALRMRDLPIGEYILRLSLVPTRTAYGILRILGNAAQATMARLLPLVCVVLRLVIKQMFRVLWRLAALSARTGCFVGHLGRRAVSAFDATCLRIFRACDAFMTPLWTQVQAWRAFWHSLRIYVL